MKAISYMGPNTLTIRDIPVPQPPQGWALIRVSHAGICGSDLTIYLGAHPRAKAPLTMGHEFSGYLVEDIPGISKGTLVTVNPLLSCGTCAPCRNGNAHVCKTLGLLGIDCDGGMAEYVIAPIEKIIAVPDGVSSKLAAFIEPIAVAVHAIRTARFVPGDKTLVFGAGAIGLATAITLQQFGADVMVCESNPVRLKIAEDLGFHCLQSGPDLLTQLLEETQGNGFDTVFDCAGHQSVVDLLPDVVRIQGRICIVAGYKKPPSMNYQKGMFKEFSIQFVRVYRPEDFSIAAGLALREPRYEKLINYELPVSEAQKGFDLLTTPTDAVKVMYQF